MSDPFNHPAVRKFQEGFNERIKRERNAAFEEAALSIEPKEPKPCDCIRDDLKSEKGNLFCSSCYCGNGGDSDRASQWCESMNNAKTVRGLKSE